MHWCSFFFLCLLFVQQHIVLLRRAAATINNGDSKPRTERIEHAKAHTERHHHRKTKTKTQAEWTEKTNANFGRGKRRRSHTNRFFEICYHFIKSFRMKNKNSLTQMNEKRREGRCEFAREREKQRMRIIYVPFGFHDWDKTLCLISLQRFLLSTIRFYTLCPILFGCSAATAAESIFARPTWIGNAQQKMVCF